MDSSKQLAILVLSCDKYSDLWNDFFNLKEKFWPDCPYPCYLATDTVDYKRDGVQLIHFGNIRLWSVCAREAIKQIKEPYIALFLEDAFIYKKIETSIVEENLKFMIGHKADYLTMERNRSGSELLPEDEIVPHIWKIDKHRNYGIDTSASIWEKEFFRKELERVDCNPWQFEVNYCKQAKTEEGLPGRIFFDDRQPFNISPEEVVVQGKFAPDTVAMFHRLGYDIDTSKREILPHRSTFIGGLKRWFRNHLRETPFLSRAVRRIASVFGVEFFS